MNGVISPGTDLEFHELANIFPMITGPEFDEFVADIREHGVRTPVVMLDGKILDGRNRFLAAKQAGVDCPYVEFDGSCTPAEFVISANLHRRQLSEPQRAMVAARLLPHFKEEAKERQRSSGGNKAEKAVVANLPQPLGKARDKAGEAVRVSGRSVSHAEKVIAKGSEKLVGAVDAGRVAVSTAAKMSDLPKSSQDEWVDGLRQSTPRKKRDKMDWRSRAVNREKAEELHSLVNRLKSLTNKSAMTVSIVAVKKTVHELVELTSTLFPLK